MVPKAVEFISTKLIILKLTDTGCDHAANNIQDAI
jgi:hypothetical protein